MAYFAPELTLIGSATGVVMGQYVFAPKLYDRFNSEICDLVKDTCPDETPSSSEW